MATLTSTPNISPSSLSISGKTTVTATISWTCPTLPAGSTITSCVLTGIATASMSKGSATIKVNGTTVSSGSNFSIDLGTANTISSVSATAVGSTGNARGTVTFSDLVYTVTYEESSEPEVDPNNAFPPFTDENWFLDADCTNLSTGTYSYGFTTAVDTGWLGYYIPVPEDWYGKIVDISIESITENASLVIQTTDTYEEIFALNSTKLSGSARVTNGRDYIIFLRTNYLGTGDVLVTGVSATIQGEIPTLTSLALNTETITIGLNSAGTVKCNIVPTDAQYNFVWSVDNPIVSVGPSGLLCNMLASSLGTTTLTVTDTLTGLTDSCSVTVVEGSGEEENIFPPFNIPDTWYLDLSCNLTEMSAYDCAFETHATWTGISISIPESWWGRKIEIRCDSINENSGFYIQEADTWSELGILNSETTSVEIEFPPLGTYSDIKLCLQNPSNTGTASMTGAFAHYTDIPVYIEPTWLEFENRIIGYKKPEATEPAAGAIICDSADAFASAISSATAGSVIYLRQGIYSFESGLSINVAGSASNYITIAGYPGELAIISNSPITFGSKAKYINFENLTVADLYDLHWGTAVKVGGGASYINIRNVEIYNINCREIVGEDTSGCNPLVIYADTTGSISNITVENCYIHDCDTGWSEALTLNGNVSNSLIKNCTIKDITNIGIDLAGNYEWTGTVGDANNQTHDCIVENCLIMNCQSPYATSAGLYSDGARDNTFRYNVIYNCQCGIELGSEQPGSVSENFHIHNNLIIDSGRCIGIGSYLETGAPNRNAYIYNNTFVCGDNNKENYGLYIERTENVNFYNNIVYGTPNTKLYSNGYNSSVNIGNNCWYQTSGSKPSVDSTGIFADPMFTNNDLTINGNYRLLANSPCINRGFNATEDLIGELDLNGNMRVNGIVEIGAFEDMGIIVSSLKIKENNQ